ncbi:MAG: hypothetical protein QOH93_1497 [Chloroflexia bacterium]|jgi:hypothetical protein|nr:hypothetical protein [Chloroflexia bacterium]
MDEQDEPFGWWGWHWQPPVPLSVMQIIEAGSTDTELMALIWAMLSRRASVLVAAEPPMAGKTTTLTALLDLMPPGTKRVYLRGHYETFDFTREEDADPRNTYVLANEMSDHLAVYLWGSRIYKTFELIEQGYAIGSTMHAETVEDVVAILNSDPLKVPPRWIANLTLVINLYVSSTYGRGMRRFNSVNLLSPGNEDGSTFMLPGVEATLLSRWDRPSDTFDHRFMRDEIVAMLAAWANCTPEEWQEDIARRKAYLDGMREEGVLGIGATRGELGRFPRVERG